MSVMSLKRIVIVATYILQVNCTFEEWSPRDQFNQFKVEKKNNATITNDVYNEVDYTTGLSNSSFNIGNIPYNPDVYLNTLQLIAKYGYDAESHVVKTDDGYLLNVHRIPCSKCQPVLLQHGLFGSSADFVISGLKKSLAYILSDAGYDIWMGNFRGNTYSRAHTNKSTSDSSFWNFSWHEHAMFDLPAMIDYVNRYTKNRVHYVGYSMGTTSLFALLSTKKEYNTKIKAAFALAPVGYMTSLKSPLRYIARFLNSIEWITENLGPHEFFPSSILTKLLAKGCEITPSNKNKICENILFITCGYDSEQLRGDLIPVIFGHNPAGTSTKAVIHYAQEIRDYGNFQMYDYGPLKNMIIYEQLTPLEYNVTNIDVPIAFFCGENDWMSEISDAQNLYNQMRNPLQFYKVPYKSFNHLDFLWGDNAPALVYKELLLLMARFRHY